MKDSVEKWYKDKANELNVIPPHEAWENVESAMEDWPKHWYQSNFVDIDKDKNDKSWDAISKQLAVQRHIRQAKRNFLLRSISITAAIALIPLWINNVTNSFLQNLNNPPLSNTLLTEQSSTSDLLVAQNEFNEESSISTPVSSALVAASETPVSQQYIRNGNDVSASTNARMTTPSEAISLNSTDNALIALNSVPSEGIPSKSSVAAHLQFRSLQPFDFGIPEMEQDKEERTQNWRIGPTAILGSASLLNPLSYRDDAMLSKVTNLSYGISASRKFHKNIVTADILLNDTKAQDVSLSSEELRTTLNYTTVALQYERVLPIFPSANKLQPELNFGVGAFGSYLTNADIISDAANSHFADFTYKKFDFGGVLTAGASVQLNKHFRLGVNGRIQSGAINLFEGRGKIPGSMFRTQSFVMGVQSKVSFTF